MSNPTPKRRRFLTAEWRNLILANYAVPEELLRPLLPPGLELDRWDGKCFASLVGFQFLRTRVLGIGWPGFRNFPEWTMPGWAKSVETFEILVFSEPHRSHKVSRNGLFRTVTVTDTVTAREPRPCTLP